MERAGDGTAGRLGVRRQQLVFFAVKTSFPRNGRSQRRRGRIICRRNEKSSREAIGGPAGDHCRRNHDFYHVVRRGGECNARGWGGKQYPLPSAAAAAARDGDRIEIAPGSYSDCAIWRANDLIIEGASADTTTITGTPCEGKALFITRGSTITIRNLALADAHVGDFNGAGIRAEGGDLTVEHVRFANDEDGILAGTLPGKRIFIRDSEFIGNGTCEGGGGCAPWGLCSGGSACSASNAHGSSARAPGTTSSRGRKRTEIIGCDIARRGRRHGEFCRRCSERRPQVLVRDGHIQKGPR